MEADADTTFEIDPDAASAMADITRMVVPTDDRDDAVARTRAAALVFARTYGFEVVLYDRSDERWTDTPNASGPFTADEIDADHRPHLPGQLRDFEAAGVRATAWLATVPALTAMLDVLQDLRVDGVLLPDALDHPKLMDRIQIGSDPASMVDRVAELQMPTPPIVFVVPAEGPTTITNYKET